MGLINKLLPLYTIQKDIKGRWRTECGLLFYIAMVLKKNPHSEEKASARWQLLNRVSRKHLARKTKKLE